MRGQGDSSQGGIDGGAPEAYPRFREFLKGYAVRGCDARGRDLRESGNMVVGSWHGLQHGFNCSRRNHELILLTFIDVLKVQNTPILKRGGREVGWGIGKVGRWPIIGYWSDVSPQNQESTAGPGLWEKGIGIAEVAVKVAPNSGYHGPKIPHRGAAVEARNVLQD